MAYTTFSDIEEAFTAPLSEFINSGASNIASAASQPLTVAVTLYVIITGVLLMLGRIDTPIREIAFRVIKIGFILALVQQASSYQQFVTGIFFETLPDEISSALSTGSAISASALDGLLTQVQEAATNIMQKAGWDWTMITYGMAALLLIVVAFIVLAVSFVVTLYAKIALSLVLALGPIFIACALYDATRRLTEAWMAQVLNFVVLQVLVVALGSLLVSILNTQVSEAASMNDALMIPLSLGATFVAAGYILYQLPGLASSLAGGGIALAYGNHAKADAANNTFVRGTRYGASKIKGAFSKSGG
ncbi:MAG: type IV secretion system protein [Sphingobium sp.]